MGSGTNFIHSTGKHWQNILDFYICQNAPVQTHVILVTMYTCVNMTCVNWKFQLELLRHHHQLTKLNNSKKWGSLSFLIVLKMCTRWKPDKRQAVSHLNAVYQLELLRHHHQDEQQQRTKKGLPYFQQLQICTLKNLTKDPVVSRLNFDALSLSHCLSQCQSNSHHPVQTWSAQQCTPQFILSSILLVLHSKTAQNTQ